MFTDPQFHVLKCNYSGCKVKLSLIAVIALAAQLRHTPFVRTLRFIKDLSFKVKLKAIWNKWIFHLNKISTPLFRVVSTTTTKSKCKTPFIWTLLIFTLSSLHFFILLLNLHDQIFESQLWVALLIKILHE